MKILFVFIMSAFTFSISTTSNANQVCAPLKKVACKAHSSDCFWDKVDNNCKSNESLKNTSEVGAQEPLPQD